jgi:hypothetical protein
VPDNERVLALEQENGRLRVQLAQFQSQLEGVQATFSLMSKTLSGILDEKASPSISRQSSAKEEDSGPSTAGNLGISQVETVSAVDETRPISDVIADQASDTNSAVNSALQPIPVPDPTPIHDLMDRIPQTEPPLSASPLQLQQIPRIWSFEYQMGHQSYTDALSACLGGFTHRLG